jgi:hypothetical protein
MKELARLLASTIPEPFISHTYIVGGAPRNFILGAPIKDLDIVFDSVSLGSGLSSVDLANELGKRLPVSITSNQYGVAIVTFHSGDFKGETLEIANTRKEKYGCTGKGYKPSFVEEANLSEDLIRRDFTCNTLVWALGDLKRGFSTSAIRDLLGTGKSDLAQRRLKCPRDAHISFQDDPTRMLRLIKFRRKYGLEPEDSVLVSAREKAQTLSQMPSNAVLNILLADLLEPFGVKAVMEDTDHLGLSETLVMISESEASFRTSLDRWCKNRPVGETFALRDRGFNVQGDLKGFSPEHRQMLKKLDPSVEFFQATRQPGKLIDMGQILTDFNLRGREAAKVTRLARNILLSEPDLFREPSLLEKKIRALL